MIRYPLPLKEGDTIGITATSSGVTGVFSDKLDNSIKELEGFNYKFIETDSVRMQVKLASTSSINRAKEFMELYMNDEVKAIIPPWGGEILMDILPHLDFEVLSKATPKWILGFSDISTLLFVFTTRLSIATAHGPNLIDFGCIPVHNSVYDSLELLKLNRGDEYTQNSLELFQKEWPSIENNIFVPYNLTEKTEWKVLGDDSDVNFEGRLIGGCLDVICKLIGTPYAPVKQFIKDYDTVGFIWYLESCEMNSSDIYRTLLQMKMNGWFKNCNGFILGRPDGYKDVSDFTLLDAYDSLSDLNVPVVYDVDLGHLPPQLTFINGAYAKINVSGGKGKVHQKFI